jgi:DNA-binding transcriptional LysR family regulator
VRVQAVIDNQGVAINDALVSNEVSQGTLHLYEDIVLDEYGYYLVYPEQSLQQQAVRAFRDWVKQEAENC